MAKTFYLLGEINSDSLGIIEAIREHKEAVEADEIECTSDRDIRVVISSEGGDEPIGYAIFDTLKAYKVGEVITEGYGQVCSIASLILQAGTVRLLSPNCIFMIHDGSVEVDKPMNGKELLDLSTQFKDNNERYYLVISKRCGIPVDRVRKWCNDERFFSAEEAVKAKMADKIVKEL